MTLTFEPDLESVKMNQHAKYVGQMLFNSKVIIARTHRHTHRTDYPTWTAKVVDDKQAEVKHNILGRIN